MAWNVRFAAPAEKALASLDPGMRRRILRFVFDRLVQREHPRSLGKALRGPDLHEYYRFRVGDYRLICSVHDDQLLILVNRIGHRREVYERNS